MDRAQGSAVQPRPRVPHRRGDGPRVISAYRLRTPRSPQAWGWTGAGPPIHGSGRAFPTGVGMDRRGLRQKGTAARVPHRRGDGPVFRVMHMVAVARSPQAWGWTGRQGFGSRVQVAFPTGVGMDRFWCGLLWTATRVPHRRGDGPCSLEIFSSFLKRSPQAWGWTARRIAAALLSAAFPTGVGMDRAGPSRRIGSARVPHRRGDGPPHPPLPAAVPTRSPQAWGWTELARRAAGQPLAFPTGVGMDRRSAYSSGR